MKAGRKKGCGPRTRRTSFSGCAVAFSPQSWHFSDQLRDGQMVLRLYLLAG
jgi:hypothetical protein